MEAFGDRIGPAHGLPREYHGEIESWQKVVSVMDALAESAKPVVIQISYGGSQVLVALRGLLRRIQIQGQSSPLESWEFVPFTASSVPLEGRRFVPNKRSDPRDGPSFVTLDQSRFEGGELSTVDGDDYFVLTLNMGELVVRVMDTNSH